MLSDEAKQILIQRGVAAEKITAGGFPITSEFLHRGNKESILKKYQLENDRLTILLTTGSFGLGEQVRLLELLETEKEKIQCVVSGKAVSEEKEMILFGSAQHPQLWDYADGVDTMEFLLNIKNILLK